ncbi:nitrous oxide reductase accessory protein NosL [Natrialbaceae archaeon A-arb3/5]
MSPSPRGFDWSDDGVPVSRAYSRRRVLGSAATVASIAVAGCLETDDTDTELAEPIDLTEGQSCDVCGMVIEDHYGPAGQLFYADGHPEERDGPAWFDSLEELLVYHAERLERGWTLREAFVTDYSRVDYDLPERDGTVYVTSHVRPDQFADATDLLYVVGSDVEGAMGEDSLPFGERDDAEAFTEDYGGSVQEWDALVA